jgi:hypothetical protein
MLTIVYPVELSIFSEPPFKTENRSILSPSCDNNVPQGMIIGPKWEEEGRKGIKNKNLGKRSF